MSRWPLLGRPASAPPEPTIDSLATQMPHRKGVLWAVESSKLVKSKTTPVDQEASAAAEAWVKNQTPASHAAEAAEVKTTDHQGPGAWAAQAAAWSHPTGEPTNAVAGTASPAGSGSPKPPVTSKRGSAGAVNSKDAPAAGNQSPSSAATASFVSVAVAGSVALAAALSAGAKPPAPHQPPAAHLPAAPAPSGKPGLPAIPPAPPPPPPPSPAELAKIAKVQKPFIELGQKILADQHPL